MAWRSQMGRVLVGRSLVGRLWHRSLLGIYTRWLGLELSLSVSEGAGRTCSFRNPYPGGGGIRRNYGIGACSRAMVAILRLLIGALRNCFMSRGRLEAEVIVLIL